jgi:hypothetical protein
LGYILDEEDYEVIPTTNRTMLTLEIDENKITSDVIFEPKKRGNVATYSFVFKPKTLASFSFTAQYNITFTQLIDIIDITKITISINGLIVFDGTIMSSPIIINSGDIVLIKINKTYLATGMFKLIGNTL